MKQTRRPFTLPSTFTSFLAVAALAVGLIHCSGASPGDPTSTSGSGGESATTSSADGGSGGDGLGGAGGVGGTAGQGAGPQGGNMPSNYNTLIANVVDGVTIMGIDLATASDGSVFAVWIEKSDTQRALRVSRSADGGQTFEAKVSINVSGATINTFTESAPRIAVSHDRVAVAFSDPQTHDIWMTSSDRTGPLKFSKATRVATGSAVSRNQFPAVAFAPDGELWLAWVTMDLPANLPQELRVYGARQSEGFAVKVITDQTNGRPCSCCGIDMIALSSGEMLVVFRGMDPPRNQYVVRHPGGAGGMWTSIQAPTTNWNFNGCPENGPVFAEAPGGKVHMAWSDPTSGAGRVWVVDSDDGGLTWTNQRPATEGFADHHTGALMAIAPSGRMWLGWKGWKPTLPSYLIHSDDGMNFEGPLALQLPQGLLFGPRLASGPSGTFAIGVVNQKSLWLVALPELSLPD